MTEELTFDQRLLAVQTSLNAPKTRKNTFGNYSYRSAEDILEAVKPLLKDHGLLLIISDEIMEVGGRVYVKATAAISCTDTSGRIDSSTVTAFAREEETKKGMDAAQITGSASSYARKYALNGLFLIDDDKDPDTDEYHKQTRPEPTAPKPNTNGATPHAEKPITDLQKRQLFTMAGEIADAKGWDKTWVKDDLYAHFNVTSTTELTTAQAAHAIRALYAVKDKGATFVDALAQKGA